jgi:hypothetical protein
MKISKDSFCRLISVFVKLNLPYYYDTSARLFLADNRTRFRSLVEGDEKYELYATVLKETLPLNKPILESMINESRGVNPPRGCRLPMAYELGISHYFKKQLEVLAFMNTAIGNIQAKWDIWMLRSPQEEYGYVQDQVARALVDAVYRRTKSSEIFSALRSN